MLKIPKKYSFLPIITVVFAFGCTSTPEPRTIDRLDLALSQSQMTASDSAAFQAWKEITDFQGCAEDYARRTAPFEALVISSLADLDSVENVLGMVLENQPQTKVVGVVSPYNQTVVTHPDGYIFIALNHYLGAESAAYVGFPAYIKRLKVLQQLPVDVALATAAALSPAQFTDSPTLLNVLLYQGALLQQALGRLPQGTPERLLLGMGEEDYEWCSKNEAQIWKSLIDRELLYSTDYAVIDRLTRPAPASALIHADAPGKAALYIALKIAQSYNKENGSPLLPEPQFYNNRKTLVKSAYAPR